MREFIKNNESFYICEECGSTFKYKKGLCKHINVKHFGAKKYYDKIKIEKAPVIKYKFNEKNKFYFPDFYIPSLNLIVEIKNSYLYNKDKDQIIAKEKATIASDFQYIIIIDKNYTQFETMLQ